MSIWYVVIFSLIYINSECKFVNHFTHSNVHNDHVGDVHKNLLNIQHHNHSLHNTNFTKLGNEDEDEEVDEEGVEEGEEEGDDDSESSESSKPNSVSDTNTSTVSKVDNESVDSSKHKPRVCGHVYQQPDYGIALMGLIDKDVFKLYAGNVIVKEISIWDIISPIEMVTNKCFSIRRPTQLPTVLCAGGIDSRNRWVNALESSRLCLVTKVKHYLPNSIDNDFVEPEDPPSSGINVFVAESQFGKPEIVINGKTLDQIKKAEIESMSTNDDYETTSWNTDLQHPEPQDNEFYGEEDAEALAETEMKKEIAPESGHARMV